MGQKELPSKVKHFTAHRTRDGEDYLVALCENGSLWIGDLNRINPSWEEIPTGYQFVESE